MNHYPDTLLLIDNEWREAQNGKHIDVINPATGKKIGQVASASIVDLDLALAAAQRGFEIWRNVSAHERCTLMRKAAELIRERADTIAQLLTQEQGKPLAEALIEVQTGADTIDWFANEALRIYGRIVPARNPVAQQLVLKEPVGPVAAFTPWNFPVNQIVRKLGAALATGCSFLLKAPEETPASPAALLDCFISAGIPKGVIGLVFGVPHEVSNYLIPHPTIRKVTFTGSTPVGKELAALAGRHMKRVTMELGGHAPVIIAQDADLDLAVKTMGAAKFRNAGQVCISPTRFLVHKDIKAAFETALVSYATQLKLGNGLTEGTTLGPLANSRRMTAMERIVKDATEKGARLITGGERVGTEGNFFSPTIFTDVPLEAKLFNDEPFGPIAALRSFETLDEALQEANRLPFGLSAYAFTRSIKTAHILSNRLETGMLWINQPATPSAELPFGGIKDSGYGSEGGPEALENYLNTKAVSIVGV